MNSRAVFGTFVKLGRREVIEVLALAGLDFAICDLEHSQVTEADAGHMITAGRSCGLPIIVRIAHFDPGQINRLLEAGAAGIQLPQVQTREQVAALRAACKYPPEGSRSVSLAQPAAGYGSEPLAEYLERSNREDTVYPLSLREWPKVRRHTTKLRTRKRPRGSTTRFRNRGNSERR